MMELLLALSFAAAELRVNTAGPVNAVSVGDTAIYRSAAGSTPKFLLLTSARRDLQSIAPATTELVVPSTEEPYFRKPEAFWELFGETRFHDYDARQSKWLSAPVKNKLRPAIEGDVIAGRFQVLDTPGFTKGSISYIATVDGRKHAFTGDLIYDGGRIWDLYSLQDAIPDVATSTRVAGRNTVRGYHGYAARASSLMASLRKIRDAKPEVIVPARGPIIRNPDAAIGQLLDRLQSLMREHFSTDALRWYWGDDNLRSRAAKMSIQEPKWMEMAEIRKLPEWVIPIQNSRLILSRSGGAYLVDCGNERIYQEVEKLREQGRFQKLEGIYVTHYHDDHSDFVAEASRRSGAPVMYAGILGSVLENPASYRLPCLTRNPIRRAALVEGTKQRWHEFDMEFASFPGQTLYHDVMLLTHPESGTRIVFTGDSFTPSGMDDYCLLNRNLLGEDQGYLYCLRYLRRLGAGVFLTNQHVDPMWTYTASQIDRMEASLRKRAVILRDLFPWDSPNYGVDEQWARFYPYALESARGRAMELSVRITNHSPKAREFVVTPRFPAGWTGAATTKVVIGAGQDGAARFRVTIPALAAPGLTIVTASIESGRDMRFPDFVEAMLQVKE